MATAMTARTGKRTCNIVTTAGSTPLTFAPAIVTNAVGRMIAATKRPMDIATTFPSMPVSMILKRESGYI